MSNSHRFTVFANRVKNNFWLSSERHFIKNVLRLQHGDVVDVFDAKGYYGSAHIQAIGSEQVELITTQDHFKEKPEARTILVVGALDPKNYPLEELSELGVDKLWIYSQPQSPKHRISDPTVHKLERRALESCKQCRRFWPLELQVFHDLQSVLSQLEHLQWPAILLDPNAKHKINSFPIHDRAAFILGSEMGMTSEELKIAQDTPLVRSASLGPYILRSSTALISVAAQRI